MKLLDFITPTGVKGNMLNVSDMLKLIMGVVVTIFALSLGQQIAKKVDDVIPGQQTTIQPFTQAKAEVTKQGSVII